jgi:hypothetical protein
LMSAAGPVPTFVISECFSHFGAAAA